MTWIYAHPWLTVSIVYLVCVGIACFIWRAFAGPYDDEGCS